jgi:hypothetical protein
LQGERSPWVASVVHGKVAWWELSEEVACETKDMFGKLKNFTVYFSQQNF